MLPITPSIHFHWCGKFTAPSPDWIHMTRPLNDYELIIVTEGTLYMADDHGSYEIPKHHYRIVPPTAIQRGDRPSSCTFYWLHFDFGTERNVPVIHAVPSTALDSAPTSGAIDSIPTSDVLDSDHSLDASIHSPVASIHSPIASIPFQGQLHHPERLLLLIHQLQDCDRRYRHQESLDLYTRLVLFELFNQNAYPGTFRSTAASQSSSALSSSRAQLYESIINYVAWNRYNRISIQEMAHYFGYHEKYLSDIFKSMAGQTLKQYILSEVMEHAKFELRDTQKTIAQIGYGLGYMDSHNFSHAFKNIVGMSPKAFRNSCIIPAKIK